MICVWFVCCRKKENVPSNKQFLFFYKDSFGVFVNMNRSFFVNIKAKKGRVMKVVRVGFGC